MPITSAKHDIDPAKDIMRRIGSLPKMCGGLILAATYIPPDSIETKGGGRLYLADKTRDESMWQGKVHLVLAMGPECYRNDARRSFAEPYCQAGDWIVIVPTAGRMVSWNGVPCRIINDIDVEMVIAAPDMAY